LHGRVDVTALDGSEQKIDVRDLKLTQQPVFVQQIE
jgi:hypothetical protein